MKQAPPFIHLDYNSHEILPSQSALPGEKPLSLFAATTTFLVGLGVIMSVVTFVIVRAS